MIMDYNKRELRRLSKMAERVLSLESKYSMYTNDELKLMTDIFRKDLNNNYTLDDILIEAFAVCREASFRILNKKHYKVQIMAGIALHEGRVVEMKTGEGKTLTEICPTYLNALTNKGVHVITVNDYLAERDYNEMKPVYELLGLSVGLVIDNTVLRKEEYYKNITYTTNTQVGFDYLRDNISYNKNYRVLRNLNFAIIDEVDSVLIDDARTPLILSAGATPSNISYDIIDRVVKSLNVNHYEHDAKYDSIYLNEKGTAFVETILHLNLISRESAEYVHMISQSLRANYLLHINKDYIVQNDEIVLIDQTTGRIADGRRFSNGLHQALEAKEGVSIKEDNETVATITYQNFFSLYNKISGMSGTVVTERQEFEEIYKLDIVSIPTNKPIMRKDLRDKIYATKSEKFKDIINDIQKTNAKGQPILVCSQTIQEAEEISNLLSMYDIEHNLLTAKSKSEEANIISKAGLENSITVSTNMAGRGTDIKPSEKSLELGGLRVIGTERSLIRRVDNQLIGRSGRQGNIGESQFYVSLEDELLSRFGSPYVLSFYERNKNKIGEITNSRLLKEIDSCQKIYCGMMYESRKQTVKYDEVLNHQREIIYNDRNKILNISDNESKLLGVFMCRTIMSRIYNMLKPYNENEEILITSEILNKIADTFNMSTTKEFSSCYYLLNRYMSLSEVTDLFSTIIIKRINSIFEKHESEVFVPYILGAILKCIDSNWIMHLNDMDVLKIIVKDQQYNQRKPEEVYRIKAYELYNEMREKVEVDFIYQWFHISMPFITNKITNN